MKKFKLFFILSLVTMLVSCNDALDIVQEGEIDNEATFQSVDDLRNFLVADVYPRVGITNEIDLSAVFTDEVGIGINNGGQGLELHRYVLNANSGHASSIWLGKYALINRVNRLIQASNTITPADANEQLEMNSILAEARVLRAWAYLQLETYFSTDMSDDNALGVMLLDFVPSVDVQLPRVANSQIYDLMEADLAYGEANLSTNSTINPFAGDYKYVTPNLINAIRARFYLYRKDYVQAQTYALAAINGGTPSNAVTYNLMWNDLSQGETIFAASRPATGSWGNIAGLFFFNSTDLTGGCFHDMGRNLFNLLDAYPSDVRRVNWIDATSAIDPGYATNSNYVSSDVLVINKYPGKGVQALRNDIKLFRLSEMFLILAETYVGGTTVDLVAAANQVQAIRTARGTGQTLPSYATPQDAWADIMLERRKELCFEGHRYVDIKRLGALAGNMSIDRNATDDEVSGTPLTLPLTDHRFTLPIPQNEVAGNVSIQQNPNY